MLKKCWTRIYNIFKCIQGKHAFENAFGKQIISIKRIWSYGPNKLDQNKFGGLIIIIALVHGKLVGATDCLHAYQYTM
jgi:hypothetical protein